MEHRISLKKARRIFIGLKKSPVTVYAAPRPGMIGLQASVMWKTPKRQVKVNQYYSPQEGHIFTMDIEY